MQKIKWWYYHHGKVPQVPTPEALPINLLSKKKRKPVRLAPWQAYSRLFCKKDSSVQAEIYEKWTAFIADDATDANVEAIDAYGHLFKNQDPKSVRFIKFQQAYIKDTLDMGAISEDTSRQITEYIEECFEAENGLCDRPWEAMRVDEIQTKEDLEKQYNDR